MNHNETLFEVLDPPAGGAARLRARIASEAARRRAARRRLQWSTAAVVAAGITVWGALSVSRSARPIPPAPELELVRIQFGLADPPSEPVTIPAALRGEVAARRVPLPTDAVVFYFVGSMSAPGNDPISSGDTADSVSETR